MMLMSTPVAMCVIAESCYSLAGRLSDDLAGDLFHLIDGEGWLRWNVQRSRYGMGGAQ